MAIAAAINALGDQIDQALSVAGAIDSDIDDASSTAGALGANATVQGLAQLSNEIETLAQQLGVARETAKEATAMAMATAVAENT